MQVSNLVFCAKLIFLQDGCNRYFHLFLDIRWVFVQFFFIKKVMMYCAIQTFLWAKLQKHLNYLESLRVGKWASAVVEWQSWRPA